MSKFLNISTDNSLGGDSASDEVVSSQKALKTYIDSTVGYTAGDGINITDNEISVDGEEAETIDVEQASTVASSTISGWSMPSSRYIDLTLGASGATYTAPANGYFQIAVLEGTILQLYNNTRGSFWKASTSDGEAFAETIACQQGDEIQCYYVYTIFRWFRFYYAESENV